MDGIDSVPRGARAREAASPPPRSRRAALRAVVDGVEYVGEMSPDGFRMRVWRGRDELGMIRGLCDPRPVPFWNDLDDGRSAEQRQAIVTGMLAAYEASGRGRAA